jgi:hypothetical protein
MPSKKISELASIGAGLSTDDLLVVVNAQTSTTCRTTIAAVLGLYTLPDFSDFECDTITVSGSGTFTDTLTNPLLKLRSGGAEGIDWALSYNAAANRQMIVKASDDVNGLRFVFAGTPQLAGWNGSVNVGIALGTSDTTTTIQGAATLGGNLTVPLTSTLQWAGGTKVSAGANGQFLVEKADGTNVLEIDSSNFNLTLASATTITLGSTSYQFGAASGLAFMKGFGCFLANAAGGAAFLVANDSATTQTLGTTNYVHVPNLQTDGFLSVGAGISGNTNPSVFWGNTGNLPCIFVHGSQASGPAGYGWKHYGGTEAWACMLDVNGSTGRHLTWRYKTAAGVSSFPMYFAEGGQAIGFASDCAFGFYNSTTPQSSPTMDARFRRTATKTITFDDGAAGAATLAITGALSTSGTVTAGGLTCTNFVTLGGIIMSTNVLYPSAGNMHMRPGGNADSSVVLEGPAGADAGTGNAYKFKGKGGLHATATNVISVRNSDDSADAKVKAGTLNLSGLPTSSSGLSSGDVWNDSGTLKIV